MGVWGVCGFMEGGRGDGEGRQGGGEGGELVRGGEGERDCVQASLYV